MKMCKLSLGEAQQFYGVHQGKPFYDKLTHFMSAGRIVAMELVRDGNSSVPVPKCRLWVCVHVPGFMARNVHADLSICLLTS